MPNIFKVFSRTKAEPYQFPDAQELAAADRAELEGLPSFDDELPPDAEEFTPISSAPPDEPVPPETEPEENPIDFAAVQAEAILADARREAEAILEKARQDAQQEADAVTEQARKVGFQDGYVQGMAQATAEVHKQREEQAKVLEKNVEQFLERAGAVLDRQMDECVDDLRDLAMAVAEKVVCVSLKSSGDVISRMIQSAIDKRKRKEWVHIYISECDAKRMSQVPASLTKALSALSDRVRIIPIADDESGTCIIEMPDEIVDASAATQLNNLRTILMDTANSASGMNLF